MRKIKNALRRNSSVIGVSVLAILFISLSTIANIKIVEKSFPLLRDIVANGIYPERQVYWDGCVVTHIPRLQQEMYLIQGSASQKNQTIGFWCNWGYMEDIRYVELNTQDISLRPIDDQDTKEYDNIHPTLYYDVDYVGCPTGADFALLLPWNVSRCEKRLVYRALEIPISWISN